MAGLLAWAADVVGGAHQDDDLDSPNGIPLIFTEEQQTYYSQLDRRAASLSRTIQDLRLRLPPSDLSQRLPHLLAHSVASNNALALQLNAHFSTKEQAQLREVRLLEENAAYEKAISGCESKIQEKKHEADLLRRKLEEMDEIEKKLKDELEDLKTALDARQSAQTGDLESVYETKVEAGASTEAEKASLLEKLEIKKRELSSKEDGIQELERRWARVQEKVLTQPTPAQREKMLDKQLHSLIEQLAAKQAQAEGLASEVHVKAKEVERLNGMWRQLESSNSETSATRNRLGRNSLLRGSSSSDYILDNLPYSTNARTEQQHRLMLMRSAFVVYILFLHILVFIKISI